MRSIPVVIAACAALLAGCTGLPVWVKPGATAADAKLQEYECDMQAKTADPGGSFDVLLQQALDSHRCMSAHGYADASIEGSVDPNKARAIIAGAEAAADTRCPGRLATDLHAAGDSVRAALDQGVNPTLALAAFSANQEKCNASAVVPIAR